MTRKSSWEDEYYDYGVPTEPASSVVPLRENDRGGLDVYLTRRQRNLSFMGGFFVFPGGKVDDADYDERIVSRCAGLTPARAAKILGGGIDPYPAIGYWIAGIRELFEEAGVLLAYNADGIMPDFDDKTARALFDSYRDDIHTGKMEFAELLEKEDLRPATDRLLYLSHWITPPGAPRRFDTRFFLSLVPTGQHPRYFEAEISEGFWMPVEEAIQKAQKGDLRMILPTFMCLKEALDYSSGEEILRACREYY